MAADYGYTNNRATIYVAHSTPCSGAHGHNNNNDMCCGCQPSFVEIAKQKITDMQTEIIILREQLEETRDALRHARDYTEQVKMDAMKIEEDNHHLIDELYNQEQLVEKIESRFSGVATAKPINDMSIEELVSMANTARHVLGAVNARIVDWCDR
jgi:hypothetical protein